jgi:hypothetical protein
MECKGFFRLSISLSGQSTYPLCELIQERLFIPIPVDGFSNENPTQEWHWQDFALGQGFAQTVEENRDDRNFRMLFCKMSNTTSKLAKTFRFTSGTFGIKN